MQEKQSIFKRGKRDFSLKKQRLLSSTDTNFKTKKVKVLFQKGVQERPDDIHLNYSTRLNEKLSSIFQPNDSIRRLSAESLLDISRNYPKIIYENINRVLSTTSSCWVDSDLYVRRAIYLMTLELLKSKDKGNIVSCSDVIFMQIRGTLSHIRNEVRIDGLTFLNEYLSIDFGKYKENFITLQYILGWSPLVCRIAQSTSFYNTLDNMFTLTVTLRKITNQMLLKLKQLSEYELIGINHSEIRSSILQLYDLLIQVSFEVASKREQKLSDYISLSGMNSIQNRRKTKNQDLCSIRIKRSLIPNVPAFVMNDREHILSIITSIILDTLYNINKYGASFMSDHKQMNKVCNSIKKVQSEINDSYISSIPDQSSLSIFFIERLLLLKARSLPSFLLQGDYKNNIYDIINDYCYILEYFKERSRCENEPLLESNHSELFEFIFFEGIEMMYFSTLSITTLKKFLTPSKYILLYLLSILLEMYVSLNQHNVHEFDLNEIKYNSKLSPMPVSINIPIEMAYKERFISAKEVFQLLLYKMIDNNGNIINENGQLTITALKVVLFLPIVLNSFGYIRNYYIDKHFSVWSPIEHIFASTNERLSMQNVSNPLKNDIILAKYWISLIPKLIYFLYHNSIDEEEQHPTCLICNLLLVLEDYIMKRISPELEDSSLLIDICRGIMPFFINKRQSISLNNVVTTLPFQHQKSIISTIPFWPYLPNKFLSSIIDQVLFFIKQESNLHYSFFIIKTLITEQYDSNISLETKMSIIVTLVNECTCKISTRFQLLHLISELFIDLSKTYIISSSDPEGNHGYYKIFLNKWFRPLINNLNIHANSEIKLSNISFFFNCVISKVIKTKSFVALEWTNSTYVKEYNFPKLIKEQICNYVAFSQHLEASYFFLEESNIILIYNAIISNVIIPNLSQCNAEDTIQLNSLKYSILTMIYVLKGYVYFDYKENSKELTKNENFLLHSVVIHIFETYISDENQYLKDDCLERLFTFSIVSISWIFSISDYKFNESISQIVEIAEHFFEKTKNNSYLVICKAIKNLANS
ncbi:hypothetical protein OJ253_2395 [Cryptosporidium canis]|uniref:Uncharacterized protein n=1 Tax=Cryptosporidium canis TaxID=195482 RepID=A0A9D5HY77_9CRYT|nr:hypothetical protein OJ253_2395 [Cryptosporidium canis]